MTSARLRLFPLIAMVLLLIPLSIEPSYALPSFGSQVDMSCNAFNGTTPFQDQSCALCHSSNSPSTRDLNQNAQSFKNGNITAICPVTATAPVADAGPNQTVTAGTIVTLDGSKSTDSGGHALTFQWTLKTVPSGSAATLSNPTSVKPTFLADKAGQYVAQLVVNNGTLSSQPATVTITTNPLNTPPVANAGPNQTVQAGATVTLDGSGSSDTDGNPLTFQWSLKSIPTGSAAVLSNAKVVKPTFVADRVGDYVVQLVVNDGTVNSTPATVTITTNPANTPPVANAGPDQSVAVGATVTLNGSGSTDTSGNTLTYDWSFTSVPAGSRTELANPTSVMPTFVADLAGMYVIQLTANNGTASTMDTITINTGSGNTLPVADAGPDQTVSMGTTVHLDGSKSKDAGGHALTYQWIRPR
ncbi:MAG: hypothetical protein HY038_09045 [Nitrospirae bacterium]|nr:hypothetical protein [Nitrospirota bacterium]